MKRLIIGGSFNPVHNGHLYLYRLLRDAVQPDVTMIIPTYLPVHKDVGNDFAEAKDRLAMCRLAFADECVEISDMEIASGHPCYSVDTLTEIHRRYSNDELYLACGSDMFLSFDTWKRYQEIYRLATVCAVSRGDELINMRMFAKEQAALGMRSILSEAPAHPISSTEIRSRILRGEDVDALLPKSVLSYIREHRLYREEV